MPGSQRCKCHARSRSAIWYWYHPNQFFMFATWLYLVYPQVKPSYRLWLWLLVFCSHCSIKTGAAKAIGYWDIDPQHRCCRDNAQRNGVADALTLYLTKTNTGQSLRDVVARKYLSWPITQFRHLLSAHRHVKGHLGLSGAPATMIVAQAYQETIYFRPCRLKRRVVSYYRE